MEEVRRLGRWAEGDKELANRRSLNFHDSARRVKDMRGWKVFMHKKEYNSLNVIIIAT